MIEASSQQGIEGTVEINALETDVGETLSALPATLDASALLRPRRAARANGRRAGSLVVARRRGLPISPEALLPAFDPVAPAKVTVASLAAGQPIQEATALANAARVALDAGQTKRGKRGLSQAKVRVEGLAPTHDKVYMFINLARSYARLAAASPDHKRSSLLKAYEALRTAVELAEALGETRVLSYALGNLGALYQREHRLEEALYLTRRALRAAEQADAPASIYRWHWQEGQLLWAQGRANEAIRSYRRAVEILEETRQETLASYGVGVAYFRQRVAPAYLDLVDALLQGAGMVQERAAANPLLVEARITMEQLKAAELRDYFRDECVADLEAKEKSLDVVLKELSPRSAVVYPIVLPDRIELLVSLPAGLERYPVRVSAEEVTETIRRFRAALEKNTTRQHLRFGQRLYRWLVQPYAEALARAKVDTLVFVPGGRCARFPWRPCTMAKTT